jgi:hypothetical protein
MGKITKLIPAQQMGGVKNHVYNSLSGNKILA